MLDVIGVRKICSSRLLFAVSILTERPPEKPRSVTHIDQAKVSAGAMVTLRTAALNLLRLVGFRSIQAGMQTVMHDITALLAMARRQPQPDAC